MAGTDQKKKCFVLSIIGEDGTAERTHADQVLKHLIKKAIGDGFEVLRADDDKNPGAITPRIITGILDADLVVADLTGSNPNVYYELAIAHGYGKPVVHIQRASEPPSTSRTFVLCATTSRILTISKPHRRNCVSTRGSQ